MDNKPLIKKEKIEKPGSYIKKKDKEKPPVISEEKKGDIKKAPSSEMFQKTEEDVHVRREHKERDKQLGNMKKNIPSPPAPPEEKKKKSKFMPIRKRNLIEEQSGKITDANLFTYPEKTITYKEPLPAQKRKKPKVKSQEIQEEIKVKLREREGAKRKDDSKKKKNIRKQLEKILCRKEENIDRINESRNATEAEIQKIEEKISIKKEEIHQNIEGSSILSEGIDKKLKDGASCQELLREKEEETFSFMEEKKEKLSYVEKSQLDISGKMEQTEHMKEKAELSLEKAYDLKKNAVARRKRTEQKLRKILKKRKRKTFQEKTVLDTLQTQGEINRLHGLSFSEHGKEKINEGTLYKRNFELYKEHAKASIERASNYEELAKWKLNRAEELIKSGGKTYMLEARLLKEEVGSLMDFAAKYRKEGKAFLGNSAASKEKADGEFKEGMSYLKEGNKYSSQGEEIYKEIWERYQKNSKEIEKNRNEMKLYFNEFSLIEFLSQNTSNYVNQTLITIKERKSLKKLIKKELSLSRSNIKKEIYKTLSEKHELGKSAHTINRGREAIKKALYSHRGFIKNRREAFMLEYKTRKLERRKKNFMDSRLKDSLLKGKKPLHYGKLQKIHTKEGEGKQEVTKKAREYNMAFNRSQRDFINSVNQLKEFEKNLDSMRFDWEEKRAAEENMAGRFSGLDYNQRDYKLSGRNIFKPAVVEEEYFREKEEQREKRRHLQEKGKEGLSSGEKACRETGEKRKSIKEKVRSLERSRRKNRQKRKKNRAEYRGNKR